MPSALILALNGLVVVFVVSSDRFKRRILDRPVRVDDTSTEAVVAEPSGGPDPGEDEP